MTISVIVPAYNAQATLAETLDSILAQTRKADEVIVVDDGSSDATAAVAKSHSLRPEVISTDNKGAASAINTGISVATCDYVAFLDADDLWLEHKLEIQSTFLGNEAGADMVFSHMEPFVCPSVADVVAKRLVFPEGPQPGYLIGTLMACRNIFMQYGFFDPALKTGYFIDWFSRVKTEGVQFRVLPEIFLKRRIRPGTLGQRTSGATDALSSDFVEIARRSILRKRSLNDNTN